MKRTVNLPGHFEGNVHINLGDNPLKVTITKGVSDASLPVLGDGGKICYRKCVERDDRGNCIDWVTVCHEDDDNS